MGTHTDQGGQGKQGRGSKLNTEGKREGGGIDRGQRKGGMDSKLTMQGK